MRCHYRRKNSRKKYATMYQITVLGTILIVQVITVAFADIESDCAAYSATTKLYHEGSCYLLTPGNAAPSAHETYCINGPNAGTYPSLTSGRLAYLPTDALRSLAFTTFIPAVGVSHVFSCTMYCFSL